MTDDDKTSDNTFTRADVRRMIAAEVSKVREQYSDYDDLKAKAAEADKSKSQIDKMSEQLATLTTRAEKADIELARVAVAEELGLTAKEAKRLGGKTREELLSSGRELIEDFGIDVEARKKGKDTPAGKGANGGGSDGNDDGAQDGDGEDDTQQRQQAPTRRGRPVEQLRSGTPATQREPEAKNPLELVKNIPRI